MPAGFTRRRFLAISAAAALVPRSSRADGAFRWRGTALGAEASLTVAGAGGGEGLRVAARVEAEIARLEDIFSLYRPRSALSRLNAEGRLAAPPPELLEILGLSGALHRATGGAFDPTVQPLWTLHAAAAAEGRRASPAETAEALSRTGWHRLHVSPARAAFSRPGMALTLNGIAQGAITDRIAALLRAEGFRDVLVDMGEVAAFGQRPGGGPWEAGIAAPDGTLLRRLALSDRALATTAPLGTAIDAAGGLGHILDPATGSAAAPWRTVSVSAPTAALADGLSTAFALMPEPAIRRTLAAFPAARLEALA